MNTETPERVLVVIDPTKDNHPALDRAIITSHIRSLHPYIHVFMGVDGDSIDTSATNPALYRDADWFLNLLKPLRDEGLKYSSQASWSTQWQQSILEAAAQIEADLIVIADYSIKASAGFLSDSNWALLRKSQCPVLIVRPEAQPQRETVLAAINVQAKDERYLALNEKVLARGKWMADRYGAAFHVVNAYSDSLNYPDRGQLVRDTGLDAECIHVKQGSPEDVISEVANALNADVVVIGTLAREGVLRAMRGNTSEKVIGKLTQDVMTLN